MPPRRGRWTDSDHDVLMAPLTVGELRRDLAHFHPQGIVPGVSATHSSYRGYYDRVALRPGPGVKVATLRKYLQVITGRRMVGSHGGTYPINDGTFVHLAAEGDLGPMIVGIGEDCTLVLEEEA